MKYITIVFGIHCSFLIVLSISLEICRSNEFFIFPKQNVCARKIGCASEVLPAQVHPISIRHAIYPGLLQVLWQKISNVGSKKVKNTYVVNQWFSGTKIEIMDHYIRPTQKGTYIFTLFMLALMTSNQSQHQNRLHIT